MDSHATELGRLPSVQSAARIVQNFLYEYKGYIKGGGLVRRKHFPLVSYQLL